MKLYLVTILLMIATSAVAADSTSKNTKTQRNPAAGGVLGVEIAVQGGGGIVHVAPSSLVVAIYNSKTDSGLKVENADTNGNGVGQSCFITGDMAKQSGIDLINLARGLKDGKLYLLCRTNEGGNALSFDLQLRD